jgi:hypothetical protein
MSKYSAVGKYALSGFALILVLLPMLLGSGFYRSFFGEINANLNYVIAFGASVLCLVSYIAYRNNQTAFFLYLLAIYMMFGKQLLAAFWFSMRLLGRWH